MQVFFKYALYILLYAYVNYCKTKSTFKEDESKLCTNLFKAATHKEAK